MIAILFPKVDKVILTTLDNPRAASVAELLVAMPKDCDKVAVIRASGVADAVSLARTINPADSLVCVTGSLHLVGAIQEKLNAQRSCGASRG
jgi:folylpolyglutamate synthase/dihydropteroate synthase